MRARRSRCTPTAGRRSSARCACSATSTTRTRGPRSPRRGSPPATTSCSATTRRTRATAATGCCGATSCETTAARRAKCARTTAAPSTRARSSAATSRWSGCATNGASRTCSPPPPRPCSRRSKRRSCRARSSPAARSPCSGRSRRRAASGASSGCADSAYCASARAMSDLAAEKKHKAPWRENIEALASAIIVALTFKVFFLEVSQIPSGSMQPTLMGNPATDVKDRVLVDKLSYRSRDPKRWEVVVFQHPNMRSLTMVKRLIGMPSEQLRVLDGDLFVRPDSNSAWKILRKPELVQRSTWRKLARAPWGVPEGRVSLAADAALSYAPKGGILDRVLDGYAESLIQPIEAARTYDIKQKGMALYPNEGHANVADLRVEGEFALGSGASALRLEFREGERTYTFVLPGPAGAGEGARVEQRDASGATSVLATAPGKSLAAGAATQVVAQNLDDELVLRVDGAEWLRVDTDHQRDTRSHVRITSSGGASTVDGLALYRDVHYTSERSTTVEFDIPAGHYVMLGDNSPESADGREWQMVEFDVRGPGGVATLRGNLRSTEENPRYARDRDGKERIFLIDEFGDRMDFARADASQKPPYPSPYVPRELIKGRAFSIFWPLRPDLGVYRIGWIR
ncbi:MAG: signal peptidase I [Planctomycetota bacterium]|nr:MAG: signal peptidase I [Planctomycetota bacterium]